ncbi:GGDEF domain-containing protein [Aliivibrio kagoshimensis]|uniref:GGDEF domain-containing protein n=1 Tax=Aliivibrio kagoshimensis TaxID=2910230 RepID=UPI003D0D78CC
MHYFKFSVFSILLLLSCSKTTYASIMAHDEWKNAFNLLRTSNKNEAIAMLSEHYLTLSPGAERIFVSMHLHAISSKKDPLRFAPSSYLPNSYETIESEMSQVMYFEDHGQNLYAAQLTKRQLDKAIRIKDDDLVALLSLQYCKNNIELQRHQVAQEYCEDVLELLQSSGKHFLDIRWVYHLLAISYQKSGEIDNALLVNRMIAKYASVASDEYPYHPKSNHLVNLDDRSTVENYLQQSLEHEIERLRAEQIQHLQTTELITLRQDELLYRLALSTLLILVVIILASRFRLKYISEKDQLTGLYNRKTAFEKILKFSASTGKTHTLVLFDLDHFKSINDTYGHPTGDIALKHIAKVLGEPMMKNDFIGRIGGEEFFIFLNGCGKDLARERVESLRARLEKSSFTSHEGKKLKITASFAYITSNTINHDFQSAYHILDEALYHAKRTGRNCVIDAINDPITAARTKDRPIEHTLVAEVE